jgi:hypothetical protein
VERLRLIRGLRNSRLVPYDRFYNVAQVDDVRELVEIPDDVRVSRNGYGVFEMDDAAVEVRSSGLPLECTPTRTEVASGDDTQYNIYFGDLHTHSRFSIDCIQREKSLRTPGDLYDYARQVAGVDFLCVTDHHQPWDVQRRRIGAGPWEHTLRDAARHNVPGEFAAFVGIEFRGPRGDTAVVFGDEPAYEEIDNPEMDRVDRFWEAMRERDFVTIPHFHNGGRLEEGEWIDAEDPAVEPVLEIYSCHGSYEAAPGELNERNTPLIKHRRPDRNGRYFLRRGYRYGFVCNSDGHKGVVANNGLTAVLTDRLDRASVLEALRARRCYGTTNARIRLLFSINGRPMGSELAETGDANISIRTAGEAPLKAVDLFRNGLLHKRWKPGTTEFSAELAEQSEEPENWYVRVIQTDNHMAYSSPIWLG